MPRASVDGSAGGDVVEPPLGEHRLDIEGDQQLILDEQQALAGKGDGRSRFGRRGACSLIGRLRGDEQNVFLRDEEEGLDARRQVVDPAFAAEIVGDAAVDQNGAEALALRR